MLGEMTKISEIVEARVLIRSSNYTFEVFKYFIPCLVGSVELHDQRTNKAMILMSSSSDDRILLKALNLKTQIVKS